MIRLPAKHCNQCMGLFTPTSPLSKRCSEACIKEAARESARRSDIRKHRKIAHAKCPVCNTPFCRLFGASRSVCSDLCSDINYRTTKKKAKAVRKARQRGATNVESFNPHAVLARDHWHCVACGIATPASKRGSIDDDAPELDHIVPLSKGGDHTMANTQCLCRSCNGKKSDKSMAWFMRSQHAITPQF